MEKQSFTEFREMVHKQILTVLPEYENARIYVHEVTKNNGIRLWALQILPEGKNCSPSIYLDHYYQRYKEGEAFSDLLSDMARFYRMHCGSMMVNVEQISDYSQMKEHIVLRLLNYEKNKELLTDAPYIMWHDLAITFRWLAHQDEVGIASALITHRECHLWNITVPELYEVALNNTERLFPWECHDMIELLKKMDGAPLAEELCELSCKMYVLTNEQRVNGAGVVLYQGVLSQVAKRLHGSFYLFPSSIHEMLLVSEQEGQSVSYFKSMVKEANETTVSQGEVLSENIYYYDVEKERVLML